jgi:uncharacterized membrane protein YcaP (DUF421 family)
MISPESSFVSGLLIILVFAGVNILLSILDLKVPKLVDRLPVVLMQGGILDRRMLSDAHITLENLLGQLRLKEAANLSEIDTLVLEPTGKLSVIKKPKYLPVTRQMMKLPAKYSGLPVALIFDGKIQTGNLARLGHERHWLEQELAKQGFSSMNTIDQLQDVLADEMDLQSKYNQHLLNITNPEVRQLFTQLRETKMQHVTELQQQIKNLMQNSHIIGG